jgi:hypothetical protein
VNIFNRTQVIMNNLKKIVAIPLFLVLTYLLQAQKTIYEPLDLDKVKFSFEDFGSMWTFDAVPLEKYKKKYNFNPDKEWLEDVQKSALQFGGGCSGAFVSEDGLIMTNHHCIRGRLGEIQKEGENIFRDGYYAKTLKDERVFPNLYVDQLIEIKDVTGEIFKAIENGKTDKEKVEAKEKAFDEITEKYAKKTGLTCKIVTLYNGGKYSLYMYKRYDDIRLVMAPDVQIAATGWDWDNFTYPRYELDFAFLRAYENGKPVKIKHFFNWSKKGAAENEPIFVVGRPGNTDRLLSIRELEFQRDIRRPVILHRLNELYHAYFKFFMNNPERKQELLGRLLSVANGRKSYAGGLMALNDDYLMTKKRDFEKNLKQKVEDDPKLKAEYGNLWNEIDAVFDELNKFEKEQLLISVSEYNASSYRQTAKNLVTYAEQMKLPEEQRYKYYKADKLNETKKRIFVQPVDVELQKSLLIAHADYLFKVMGKDYALLKIAYGGKTGIDAQNYVLENTKLIDESFVEGLLNDPDAILSSKDPLIHYYTTSRIVTATISGKREKLYNTLEVLNNKLGRLIFEAYGEIIPPDATSTLRISDGVIKQYEYNGTIAPGKTTYYGLYDRYFSFGEKDYPWGLHERWKKPPQGLDLSIPIGFASTNDIVGGNSGSSIINRNAEIIGLVHDGNLESLAGAYAFLEENNRAVATDSWGLMEALKLVYKTTRLVKELENAKME